MTAASMSVNMTPSLMDMVQAYIYGFPLLLMNQTRTSALRNPVSSVNVLEHENEFPDATFRDIVRPNVDTLYSSAWLDISSGPVVLTIPPIDDRYLLVALFDAWTNNFAGASNLDVLDSDKGGTFVVALPGWKGEIPGKATRFDAPTPFVWMLIRTEVHGVDDLAAANAIQNAMSLSPLEPCSSKSNSSTLNLKSSDVECPVEPPPDVVGNLSGVEFFTLMAQLIEEQGTLLPQDLPTLRMLGPMGVGPFAPTTVQRLRPSLRIQMQVAVTVARKLITTASQALSDSSTGWSPSPVDVPIGDYGTAYFVRTLTATEGFGANRAEFAVYQSTATDDNGKPLSGEGGAVYSITFDAGELPPVEGFWSITVYDANGYLTANSINRYAVGSNSNLVKNDSGATVLTLAHACDAVDACDDGANWLPVPAAPFSLTLRMYGPSEAILTETWTPPPPRLQS